MNTSLRLFSRFCSLVLITCTYHLSTAQVTSKDYAVLLQCEVDTVAPAVTIKWPTDNNATGYRIFKKQRDAVSWGTALATLNATATSYVDNNVAKGEAVEYYVQRTHAGRLAHGYIFANIVAQPIAHRGHVLLLIDQNYAAPLNAEIENLKWDIIKDGWALTTRVIPRASTPAQVKSIIQQTQQQTNKPTTIYILGRVAVPYSGGFRAEQGQVFPPDGHAEHGGAWPTDMYYATLNDDFWTDVTVNDTTPDRVQNRNIPGDGKFDQMFIGNEPAQLEVGRVDLVNMPAFNKSDTALIKQYLEKATRFRNGQTEVVNRGLIDDNFGPMSGEAFAASAWRAFSTMFGDSIDAADYMTETKKRNYLFTYGAGAGTYTSASGVANTNQFVNDSVTQMFTMLFGSYFGDWDSQNNLLRAPLASPNGGLMNVWSGRPHWHFHHMASGLHTGFAAKLTSNNFFSNDVQPSGYVHNICPTFVSINMMGDPTLRLHMRAHNTQLQAQAINNGMHINLQWTATTGAYGYLLSKSRNPFDGFSHPILLSANATSFLDTVPYFGTGNYLIRPVFLEHTQSGFYLNPLPGSIDSAVSVNPNSISKNTFNPMASVSLFPNPSSQTVWITTAQEYEALTVEFYNLMGTNVLNCLINAGEPIAVDMLAPGTYFVKVHTNNGSSMQKLIITR